MRSMFQAMSYSYLPIEFVAQVDNAALHISQWLDDVRLDRVLLITNNSLSRSDREAGNTLAAFQAQLAERCVGVFSAVQAHTPYEDVWAGVQLARQVRADVLVAIGGGSVIDATKAIQLAVNAEVESVEQLREYAQFGDGSRGPKAGSALSKVNPVRYLAVPTTLSGAEFSNTAGVLNPKTGTKEGYRHTHLCPQGIIYSPVLASHTPEWLWLSTAIRSLDHAIEGFCADDAHPYLEGQFLHAMKLFAEFLPRIKHDAGDLHARSQLQHAVWLACAGLGRVRHGASHGIGYALGAQCGVPHGYTSCVMLPAVLRWNQETNRDRQELIAQALRGQGSAADQVADLIAGLGLPKSLSDVGVERAQLAAIAEASAKHKVVRSNPRPISSAADVMEILEIAWRQG